MSLMDKVEFSVGEESCGQITLSHWGWENAIIEVGTIFVFYHCLHLYAILELVCLFVCLFVAFLPLNIFVDICFVISARLSIC